MGADSNPNLTLVIIWCRTDVPDIRLGHNFHPYRLPDSALGSVEHSAAVQLLFAPGVIGGVTEIVYADQNTDGEILFYKV